MNPQNLIRLRSDDVTWTATGDEVVVLDLRTSQYLQLNDTAATLWKRLAVGATLADLADQLTATHNASRAQAEADAIDLVQQLSERDLIAQQRPV